MKSVFSMKSPLAALVIVFTAAGVTLIYLFQSKWFFLDNVTIVNVNSSKMMNVTSATIVNVNNEPVFVIIMASYPRDNGRSPYYVKKAVQSILAQSYPHWQLFVTGDNYKNDTEFRALFNTIPSSKLFLDNLPKPGERGKLTGYELWSSGGVTAMNNAMERAERHHNDCKTSREVYFTNHDDDDIWSKDHLHEMLQIYKRFPSVVFAWAKGYYCGTGGNPYPSLNVQQNTVNNWPHGFAGQVLHSSWSWKMSVFCRFRYRAMWDFPPDYKHGKVADADLFDVVRKYILAKKLDYFHSNQATLEHLVEMGRPCGKNGKLWYPD